MSSARTARAKTAKKSDTSKKSKKSTTKGKSKKTVAKKRKQPTKKGRKAKRQKKSEEEVEASDEEKSDEEKSDEEKSDEESDEEKGEDAKEESTKSEKKGRKGKKVKEDEPPPKVFDGVISGTVMSFGSGDMSQLGLGQADNVRERKKPTIIKTLEDWTIARIAVGALHNATIDTTGMVWTWGCNDDLALGREVVQDGDEWLPAPVHDIKEFVIAVGCGASHTIALTHKGNVYTWGSYRDATGILGFDQKEEKQKLPSLVTGLKGHKVVQIACGDHHDMVLTDKGHVFEWGVIGFGTRGSDRLKKVKLAPRRVTFKGRKKIVGIYAGGSSSFAVTTDGQVYAWGPNNYGQTGCPLTAKKKEKAPRKPKKTTTESNTAPSDSSNPTPAPQDTKSDESTKKENKQKKVVEEKKEEKKEEVIVILVPTLVPDLPPIDKVAAAALHTLFLTKDGKVYSVGKGKDGRLGKGVLQDSFTPSAIDIKLQTDDVVVAISCGEAHSLAITKNGHLFTWGSGDLLQLGLDHEKDTPTPTEVISKALTTPPRKIIAAGGGSQHTLILVIDENPVAKPYKPHPPPVIAPPKKVVAENEENKKEENKEESTDKADKSTDTQTTDTSEPMEVEQGKESAKVQNKSS